MAIRINNVVLDLDENIEDLKDKVNKKLKLKKDQVKKFNIIKESIDARKKNNIRLIYNVEIQCENESKIVNRAKSKDVKIEKETKEEPLIFGDKKLKHRPVVVGMGPAGMFAALMLAQNGYNPIVIERGERVEDRTKTVNDFWKTGELNTESNVQFGEGGAGAFSDGKLTTRIKDRRCEIVLKEFVSAGAPEEITYVGKPHIGTDILKEVVKNIREKIISLGGTVLFSSKLEDLKIKDNKLIGIIVNGEEIPCDTLILALGHSSRDTYEMLFNKGVIMSPKPFAIGVRIEHSQRFIDENQYGKFAGHPKLKAADYRLSYTSNKTKRAVYSFCMCPGGEVVASSSEDKMLVTNGMSYYKRDKENANAGIVVTVGENDFAGNTPLSGIEFQRHYESLAYKLGGGNYIAPIQLVGDFLKDSVSTKLGSIKPSYRPGYEFADLRKCLPAGVIDTLKEGLVEFDKKIKGFAADDVVMTGVETRTSAPVRIERNEKFQSISLEGLYPCGEGAGFAGGIVSAAVDGIKAAEHLMKEYSPK